MRFSKILRKTVFVLSATAATLLFTHSQASAGYISLAEFHLVGTGTDGASLAANVKFERDGDLLRITLTNTSAADVLVQSNVMTALFFDLDRMLVPFSAVLGPNSTVLFDSQGQPAGGVVGGEWAYDGSVSGAPGGGTKGISSSGFGIFGPDELFPGDNLDSPESVNGINYGITSAGDNPFTGQAMVTGGPSSDSNETPLIKNSVEFMFSGLTAGAILIPGTKIAVQYGTSLATGGELPGGDAVIFVPEPASITMLVIGCIGLCGYGARRRKKENRVTAA